VKVIVEYPSLEDDGVDNSAAIDEESTKEKHEFPELSRATKPQELPISDAHVCKRFVFFA